MIRQRRTPGPEIPDPLTMSFNKALEFEREGWPEWGLRWQFWSRSDIPREFRNGSEPDPRPLLTMPAEEAAKWKERHRRWQEGRRRWLEEAAQ